MTKHWPVHLRPAVQLLGQDDSLVCQALHVSGVRDTFDIQIISCCIAQFLMIWKFVIKFLSLIGLVKHPNGCRYKRLLMLLKQEVQTCLSLLLNGLFCFVRKTEWVRVIVQHAPSPVWFLQLSMLSLGQAVVSHHPPPSTPQQTPKDPSLLRK